MGFECTAICKSIEKRLRIVGFESERVMELDKIWEGQIHECPEFHRLMLSFLKHETVLALKQEMIPAVVRCPCSKELPILIPSGSWVYPEGSQFICGKCWDRTEKDNQEVTEDGS